MIPSVPAWQVRATFVDSVRSTFALRDPAL